MKHKSDSINLKIIYLSIVILQILWGQKLWAWGHFQEVETHGKSFLVYNYLKGIPIRYCLELDDPTYDKEKLVQQIEAALRVWLTGLEKVGVPRAPMMSQVSCNETPSVRYLIQAQASDIQLSAYHFLSKHQERRVPQIVVNRNLTQLRSGQNSLIEDFSKFIPLHLEFMRFLERLSFTGQKTVKDLSQLLQVTYQKLFFTSYSTLIHETGHAFGLCDTYKEGQYLCDPKYTSKTHNSSVMLAADQYFLSKDDHDGLRQLLLRDFN